MSPETSPNLQFDTAEVETSRPAQCAFCKAAIVESYYTVDSNVSCEPCHGKIKATLDGQPMHRALTRAVLFGIGAALDGTVLYFAVTAITGYHIGLVGIAIGFIVGRAIRISSGGIGGRPFQVLAAILTYLSIASANVPEIIREIRAQREQHAATAKPNDSPAASPQGVERNGSPEVSADSSQAPSGRPSVAEVIRALAALVGLGLALPILMATKSPISLLIIAFSMWEAWKLNQRARLALSGPFAVTPPTEPARAG